MNIHPIFVHFPIAFFTIYAILELVRFKKITVQPYWFYVKAVMVIIGALSSIVTYITGDMSEELFRNSAYIRSIVDTHSSFALATVIIFGILAVCYLIAWINLQTKGFDNKFWQILTAVANWILNGWPSIVLALVGFACITITGGLGGAMVHGPDADPFFSPIFHLLIKQ